MNKLFVALQNRLISLGCKFSDRFNEQHRNRGEQFPHELPAAYIELQESQGALYNEYSVIIYIEQMSIEDRSATTLAAAQESDVVAFVEKIQKGLDKWQPLDNSGIMSAESAKQDTNYTEYSFWVLEFKVMVRRC